MNFKRSISAFLFIFVVFALFTVTGCEEQKSNSVSQSGQAGSTKTKKVELIISAAASLTESMEEIAKVYETKHTNIKLTYNFGGSGTLQRQIEQGAPADLFISAGKKQTDELLKAGKLEPELTKFFLKNELVLVVPKKSNLEIQTLDDLTEDTVSEIAIGMPDSVPAGKYAEQVLHFYKLWDALQPKLVLTKDVKQVISYVDTDNVDAGFVYKTDAAHAQGVKMILTMDPKSHDPIEYQAGVVSASKHPDEAKTFFEFLFSEEVQHVFNKYGFTASGINR
ncbi:molybdate ABC transporter substrate-binding protein [Paenibacillus puldeungensis]|uniref:Molybdate ABC transporter substrate-binding protein n=1 Tax=Paenibacillus puldeungensis TaxID=696536 RepID=A0ABW3S2N1_9BACL